MRAYAIVIAGLIVILGSIALLVGNRSMPGKGAGFQPPPVTIEAAMTELEQRQQFLHSVGTLQAVRGIDVTSESSGQITEINFQSGDQVQKGQLLLVLNDAVEHAAKRNQTAALKLAQLQFDRDKKLARTKSISNTQFDQSRSALEQATAQLAETEARLNNKRIHAPFNGTVGIRAVELGDYVSPGDLIVTLQDLTQLNLDFTVPAQSVPLLAVGQAVSFTVSAYPGKIFNGQILALDAKVETSTRNLKVRARVTGETGLLPGMFAEVKVTVGESRQQVVVPETAITYSLHGNSVYVVEKSAKGLTVRSQIVKTGEVRNGRVAILSGLDTGSQVVISGQNKLYPGATVAVNESSILLPRAAASTDKRKSH